MKISFTARAVWLIACSAFAVLLLPVVACRAAELREIPGGKWLLKNALVEAEVDPARGGRVSQFRDLAFAEPLIRNPASQGLFVDHLTEQDWPGELWERRYDAKALSASGAEVALELSTVIEGQFRTAGQPQSKGLILRKTYRLADGECGLRVEHRLENPTAENRRFSLWIQNIQHVGSDPRGNTTVRAAKAGVYRFKMPEQPHGQAWSRYQDSLAAWYAVMDPESGQAVAYFQDWDFLDAHYSAGAAYTMEWFMTPIGIPPGGAWSTTSRMISRKVSSDLCAIGPELWAGASLNKVEEAIRLTVGGDAAAKPLMLEGAIFHRAGNSDRFTRLSQQSPVKMPLHSGTNEIPLPKGCKPPVALSVTINGGGAPLVLNEYLGGASFPANEPLPGYPPIWDVPIPEKAPKLPRPEKLVFADDAAGTALLVNGPLTLGQNLAETLKTGGWSVANVYEIAEGKERGLRGFPSSYGDILAQRLIVMANVDHRMLRATERVLLRDYLEAGGTLLVLGGTATTPRSAERNPLFPGSIAPGPDGFVPDVAVRQVLRSQALNPALFPDVAGCVFWRGPEAAVQAVVGDRALVSIAEVGQGRIVYCGLTGMGTVRPADYWQLPAWSALLKQLAGLAAGGNR